MRIATRPAGIATLLAASLVATAPAAAFQTLIVTEIFAGPPNTFGTFAAAIAAADPGDAIIADKAFPVRVTQPIVIDKPLTLIGNGATVTPPAGQNAFEIDVGRRGHVTLKFFGIHSDGGNGVVIDSAENVRLEGMNLQGNGGGTGIDVGRRTDLEVTNSHFDRWRNAVRLKRTRTGEFVIERNHFSRNRVAANLGDGSAVVADNTFVDNAVGVRSTGNRTVELKKNIFFNNGTAAVGRFLTDGNNNFHANGTDVDGALTLNPGQ